MVLYTVHGHECSAFCKWSELTFVMTRGKLSLVYIKLTTGTYNSTISHIMHINIWLVNLNRERATLANMTYM